MLMGLDALVMVVTLRGSDSCQHNLLQRKVVLRISCVMASRWSFLIDRAWIPLPLGSKWPAPSISFIQRFSSLKKTSGIIGSREALQAIKDGQDPTSIRQKWQEPLEQFRNLRSKYLLY